ncbi:MAG: transposase [Patescibacteria group bacterium]|nr:transposase [Patescibacteria group bacterium]
MRKFRFVDSEIYHIYNRGVDKRDIFIKEEDYFRFIHSLYELNDANAVINSGLNCNNNLELETKENRKLLVEIIIFTLMPNHFHLILKQKMEKGIEKFMHKLGTGYTLYFNQKQKRSGSLFQGRYKAKIVDNNIYFSHIPFYIHSNPLKLNYRGSTSLEFLESYRWSSFLDYIGIMNYPSVTNRSLILNYFGDEQTYKREFLNWLKIKEVEPR